jgi:molybdate transport system regulatory protein
MMDFLDCVFQTGSIRQAAKSKEMSYRKAWLTVREIEEIVGKPVIERVTGGPNGGGSQPSKFGRMLLRSYGRIDARANGAVKKELKHLSFAVVAKSMIKRRIS